MEADMRPATLLAIDAVIEGVTGVLLVIAPNLVAWALLAERIEDAGVVLARIGGIALISLAVACWDTRDDAARRKDVVALFVYNLLSGALLLWIGFVEETVGLLLWPAVVVHLVMAGLFGAARLNSR